MMLRNWTVEHLGRRAFLSKGSTTDLLRRADWVSDIKQSQPMTEQEALHVVRMYPALYLCARQVR